MAGDYGKQGWRQKESWSQWGPYAGQQKGSRKGGWKQPNEGWHQGPWWDRKEAPAWGGGGRASRGGGGSPWRGLREVAGVARTALDAVATVRAIVAPSATEVAPPSAEEPKQRAFLATARRWLAGETSPSPPPASHGGSPRRRCAIPRPLTTSWAGSGGGSGHDAPEEGGASAGAGQAS